MTRQEWGSRKRRESMSKRLGKRRTTAIREAADDRCHYCRRKVTNRSGPRKATYDHRIARKNGGTDDLENVVLACHRCNTRKQARSEEAFTGVV